MAVAKYGYHYLDGMLQVQPGEQMVLDRIVKDKDEGNQTFSAIAGKLNQEGVLNRGKFWNPSTIAYLYQQRKEEGHGDKAEAV